MQMYGIEGQKIPACTYSHIIQLWNIWKLAKRHKKSSQRPAFRFGHELSWQPLGESNPSLQNENLPS